MLKIGVLSDTHLTAPAGNFLGNMQQKIRNKLTLEDLRTIVAEHFRGVALIIHAGDFVETAVADMLREFAPLEAVHGNMDTIEVERAFPATRVLEIGGFKIGITHGDGAPQGIIERVSAKFTGVDAIVFGHSHQPVNERRNGVLLFNPGSPTDRIFAPYNSVGLLELSDTISGQIIRLS